MVMETMTYMLTANLTADPAITVHFRDFGQLSFTGNAHTRHILELDAPTLSLDNENTMITDPVEHSIRRDLPKVATRTIQICADPPLQPRVKIYGRFSPGEVRGSFLKSEVKSNATDKEKARAVAWEEDDAGMMAGFSLQHMVDQLLRFDTEVTWGPSWMAPAFKACGTEPGNMCW